jgi:hypothetical protein
MNKEDHNLGGRILESAKINYSIADEYSVIFTI